MIRRSIILVVLPLILFGSALALWHRTDTRPAAWNESVHLLLALDYRDLLTQGTPVTTNWASVYPPLYHLSIIPALSLGLPSAGHAVATHIVYAALMLAGFILLARGFGRSTEEGVASALLFWSMPIVFFTARRPLLDFPLSACVCFGMALLWRTKRFADPLYSFSWGVLSGLGLLIKPFYPIPFLLPCLLLLYQAGDEENLGERFRWRNFSLGVGAALLISLPWYAWQGPVFLRNVVNIAGEVGAAEGDPGANSIAGWLFYFRALWDQCGPLGLTLIVGGLLAAMVRHKRLKGKGFLGAWMLSSYIVQTLEHNKDARYTMPLLAALCLAAMAGWMSLFQRPWAKRMVLAVTALVFIGIARIYDRPRQEDWHHSEIGAVMAAHREPQAPFILASVLSNHLSFFGRGLRFSMRAQGLTMFTRPCGNPQADFTQFVVLKTGDIGPMSESLRQEADHLLKSGRAFHRLFHPLLEIPLPDGSQATVYGRDPAHRFEVGVLSKADLQTRLAQSLRSLVKGPLQVQISGDPSDWREGRFKEIRITGGPLSVRGIPVDSVDLRLRGVWINLYQLWDHRAPGLLAFQSLAPRIVIKAADLQELLRKRAKGFDAVTVQFRNGRLEGSARYKGTPLTLSASVSLEGVPPQLTARLERAQAAGIPLPIWLLARARRQAIPLDPVPSFPGRLEIHHVTLAENTLTIEP